MLNTLAWLLGFSALMPYPALPVGSHSGLQAGHVVALFLTAFHARYLIRRRVHLLVVMVLVLAMVPALALQPWQSSNLHAALGQCAALCVVLAAGCVDRDAYPSLVKGVCGATAVHVLVGLLQQYAYRSEQFPFLSLYVNPSFAPLDQGTTSWKTYALYTKRSFGLFPEPSAMAASLGAWLVLLGFLLLGPRHNVPDALFRHRHGLLGVFVGGLVLVVLGQSGGSAAIILGLAPAVVLHALAAWRSASTVQNAKALLVLVVGLLTAGITLFVGHERIVRELSQAASWVDRFRSIVYGFSSLLQGDVYDFLFGYGLGAVAPMTQAATGATSVHSWIGSYVMGTGATGALALGGIVLYVVHQIFPSRQRVMGYSVLFVWLFAALVVTGYSQLLAMWLCLGLLLHWRRLHG